MLELAAVLARLGLCSVLLYWMEWTAQGLERLQSPPYNTIGNIGMLELADVLARLGLCSVLLC